MEPLVPQRKIVEQEVRQPDGTTVLQRDVFHRDVNGDWKPESFSTKEADKGRSVAPRGRRRCRSLQTFSGAVARVNIVPELDVVFLDFPTKVHLASLADMGEINEPTVEVFDLHAQFLNTPQLQIELQHVHQKPGDLFAADFSARLF